MSPPKVWTFPIISSRARLASGDLAPALTTHSRGAAQCGVVPRPPSSSQRAALSLRVAECPSPHAVADRRVEIWLPEAAAEVRSPKRAMRARTVLRATPRRTAVCECSRPSRRALRASGARIWSRDDNAEQARAGPVIGGRRGREREHSGGDDWLVDEQSDALDDVAEIPHVPGPSVRVERRPGIAGEGLRGQIRSRRTRAATQPGPHWWRRRSTRRQARPALAAEARDNAILEDLEQLCLQGR